MLVPVKNARLLFQIFFPLFDFARDSLHITSLPTETIRNDAALIAWILEQFWKHPEYLERFKQERPGLSRRKREIIDGFSRLRAGEFLVLAHTPRGSILADENNEIYLVKGLGSEITELTLHKTPPVQFRTVLLPLLGDIVTQGTVVLRLDPPDPEWVKKAQQAYAKAQEEKSILTQL